MSGRFQVTLHGTGLCVPVEGAKPVRGFFTIRRVLADSSEEAERSALATLEQEERYRGLIETTERELGSRAGCRVRLESMGELSWFRWHFSRHSPSLIFYSDDENDSFSVERMSALGTVLQIRTSVARRHRSPHR